MSKPTRTIKTGGDTGRISREDARAATLAASHVSVNDLAAMGEAERSATVARLAHPANDWATKYADQAVRWLGETDDGNRRREYFRGQFAYALMGVDPFDGSSEAVQHALWHVGLMDEARQEATDWLATLPPEVRATVPGGLMWWLHGAQHYRSRPATPEEIAWLRETGALDG